MSAPALWVFLAVFLVGVVSGAAEEKPQKLDLNKATAEELAQLPGVGEVIAARIIRHREKSGPFRSVDELLVIRGISEKKLDALRPLVTVEEENKDKKEPEGKDKKGSDQAQDSRRSSAISVPLMSSDGPITATNPQKAK